MKKAFYPRLALMNIRRNRSFYLPYLAAGALIVALHYILRSISVMVVESKITGYAHLQEMLTISAHVCGILSLLVLFYLNSFVMKQRKREFGLYSILGMGKRHIAIVLSWEILLTAFASIAGGIIGGALLSQLLFLVLMHLIRIPVSLTFRIPLGEAAATAVLFLAGFLVVLAAGVLSVWRSNPADLLRSANQGEREPKTRWLLAALGALTLGGGYFLALRVRSPVDAFNSFFLAVLLVIAGTFLLFIAGSILILKAMRGNKRLYYQPGNFIAISGMLYRMKRNAAGLANICILSTCVLVTLSSTMCLFLGEEGALRERFPRQVNVEYSEPEADTPELAAQAAARHAAENGFAVENAFGYFDLHFVASGENGVFTPYNTHSLQYNSIHCIPLEDFNRITGSQTVLEPGEALVWFQEERDRLTGNISLNGAAYAIKGEIPKPAFISGLGPSNEVVAVLPERADLEGIGASIRSLGENMAFYEKYIYWYDAAGDADALPAFYESIAPFLREAFPNVAYIDNIDAARNDFYQIYGGLLFIGIFFVSLFLIATVLIIYYKQITEGFDDHMRFQIMEKVGMSGAEVRATIQKQILLVFFLPLGMAILHIAAAFPALRLLLLMFEMDNTALFAGCTAGSILLFSVLYFVVYRLTARTYYKIVRTHHFGGVL